MSTADTIVTVVVVALVIALFVIAIVTKKIPQARKLALALVIEAEAKYGSGTGEIKYAEVVGKLYSLLPWTIKLFVSEKFIDNMIEDAVQFMKEKLGEERIQNSTVGL